MLQCRSLYQYTFNVQETQVRSDRRVQIVMHSHGTNLHLHRCLCLQHSMDSWPVALQLQLHVLQFMSFQIHLCLGTSAVRSVMTVSTPKS